MRLHYLQHVPFEDLGAIETWAKHNNFTITKTQLFSGDPFPETEDIDWLIVLGGPMGVSDIKQYSWMKEELKFISEVINKKKIIIGICLGAQLIAHTLGSNIKKNKYREIGWHTLSFHPEALEHPFFYNIPLHIPAFHWHGETFNLPKEAKLIGSSEACENQAFILDDHVLGFQFHLETTPNTAFLLIKNCKKDLAQGSYVNSIEEITANSQKYHMLNKRLFQILDNIIENMHMLNNSSKSKKAIA